MNKPVTNCLLCERELQSKVGWTELFLKTLPQTICERCEGRFEQIETQREADVISLYHYNEAMKDFLHRYKFLHDVLLAHVFNRVIHQQLKHEKGLIVPIPMHPEHLKIRTFAHIDELLNAAQIPFEHHLVKISSEKQALKTRQERLQSSQLFDIIDYSKVAGKSILLIDDIYTTGTTMRHAMKALQQAGAVNISGLTLIHG